MNAKIGSCQEFFFVKKHFGLNIKLKCFILDKTATKTYNLQKKIQKGAKITLCWYIRRYKDNATSCFTKKYKKN